MGEQPKTGLLLAGTILGIVFAVWFLVTLLNSKGEIQAQALANLIGAGIGAFGAYLAVRWPVMRAERERLDNLAELGKAVFNALLSRLQHMDAIVELLPSYNGSHPTVDAIRIGILRLRYVSRKPISATLRAQLAAHFPYVDNEIDMLDDALDEWWSKFNDAFHKGYYSKPQVEISEALHKAADAFATAIDARGAILIRFKAPFARAGNERYWDPDISDVAQMTAALEEFRKRIP